MRTAQNRLVLAAALLACLCASAVAVTTEEEAFLVRALSSSEVVTYGPCDEPKCPAIQKPTGPPPPGYECNCADPSEVEDCGCKLKTGCCAEIEKEAKKKRECACKSSRIRTRARTVVVDPNAPKRPPKNTQRKFAPPTSEPNPVPPAGDEECRPNVAKLGPGNCRRGGTSRTCEDKNSGCKNKDNASMGFVAAALTNEIDPTDKPESCEGEVDANDAVATGTGPQGTSIATVQLKNKCTGKKRWLHKANVYIEAPKVMSKTGQVVGIGQSSVSASSSSAVDPSIGSQLPAGLNVGSLAGLNPPNAVGSTTSSDPAAGPVNAAATAVTPSQLEGMIQSAVRKALQGSGRSGRPVPQSSGSSSGSVQAVVNSLSQSSLARSLLSGSSSAAGSLSAPPGSSSQAVPLSSSKK